MSNLAVANFIESLLIHYPVRHDSEEREDAWVNSYSAALQKYPASLLDLVAKEIVRTRKYRNFPLLSEILDKCEEVEKRAKYELAASKLPMAKEFNPKGQIPEHRGQLAKTLIMCPLGQQAAREGWIGALYAFAKRHGRLPSDDKWMPDSSDRWDAAYNGMTEMAACKKQAKEFDETYAWCVRHGHKFTRMGSDLLKEREALVDMVLHGVVK